MFKHVTVAIVALLLLGVGYAAVPFEQLLYVGRAFPFYNDSSNPEQQKYIDGIRAGHLAERMASVVSNSLMLKSDIGIGFESCGKANAFFNPQRRAIVVCSEFVDMIAKTALNDREYMMKLPREQFAQVIDGLIWGIFFHELAHAVIRTNNVPVTGREEDVADQFTVWYTVNFVNLDHHLIVMPTIWFWSRLTKDRDIPSMSEQERRSFMSNEHSLDEQRVYNLACWALGTGSEGGADAAQYAGLPSERAQRCRGEYAQVDMGMKNHFKKYFKARPLRGAW